jgi:hypothetical protein
MKTIVIIYSIAAQMQHVYMPSQKKIRHAVKEREGNSHLRTAQLRVRVKAAVTLGRMFILLIFKSRSRLSSLSVLNFLRL